MGVVSDQILILTKRSNWERTCSKASVEADDREIRPCSGSVERNWAVGALAPWWRAAMGEACCCPREDPAWGSLEEDDRLVSLLASCVSESPLAISENLLLD